jgi:hypothetical protein
MPKILPVLLALLPFAATAQPPADEPLAGPCRSAWGTDDRPGSGRAKSGVHASEDARIEPSLCDDKGVRRNARATVALLRRGPDFTEFDDAGAVVRRAEQAARIVLNAPLHGDVRRDVVVAAGLPAVKKRLCRAERFQDQRHYSNCSGVLVSPDTVLTAAHCIDEHNPAEIIVMTDLRVERGRAPPLELAASDPRLRRVAWSVAYRSPGGHDIGVLRLAGGVGPGRAIELPEGEDGLKRGQPVYALGHPNGLPMKLAPGGVVRSVYDPVDFGTNLPIFRGNSGGPVFDAATHRLVGIVRSGPGDWYHKAAGATPQDADTDCATSLCSLAPAHQRAECDRSEVANRVSSIPPWLRSLALGGGAGDPDNGAAAAAEKK